MSEPRPVSAGDVDARLRRLMLIVRQGLYFVADELGKEYGLDRPCKRCDYERREDRRSGSKQERAA